MSLLERLESFFSRHAPAERGNRIVVAYSGGADSTCLLWGLARLAPRLGLRPIAAHLDHGLDPAARGRARAAGEGARRLGVELIAERRPVEVGADGLEAAARRERYAFLEEVRRDRRAAWIATGHQRDDQLETVLLRLLFGSGVEGLAGIPRRRGRIVRPLLTTGRGEIERTLRAAGLSWVEDSTNRAPERPRNRLRHLVLPRLTARDPELPATTLRLADAAAGAAAAVEGRLRPLLRPRPEERGASVDRAALAALPRPLLPAALGLLQRAAGAPYPSGQAARAELARQLAVADRAGCDCGDGWRWRERDGRLHLEPPSSRAGRGTERFAYTLEVPGEVSIPEIAVRLRVDHRPVERWMFVGSPRRAGLGLPLASGDRLTVRNRRPGDRIRPLGCPGQRRLKDVLIDRRIPHRERDRLPLLCLGDEVVWVPGVTIEHDFRLTGQSSAWVAEVIPLEAGAGETASAGEVPITEGTMEGQR